MIHRARVPNGGLNASTLMPKSASTGVGSRPPIFLRVGMIVRLCNQRIFSVTADKDYTLEAAQELDVYPHLATVTYLTGGLAAGQAPTLILEHAPDPRAGGDESDAVEDSAEQDLGSKDSEEESDEDDGGRGKLRSPYATGPEGVRRAWLSSPTPGKHGALQEESTDFSHVLHRIKISESICRA